MYTCTFNSYGLRAAVIIDTALSITRAQFTERLERTRGDDEISNLFNACGGWNTSDITMTKQMMSDARILNYVEFSPTGQCMIQYSERFHEKGKFTFGNVKRQNILMNMFKHTKESIEVPIRAYVCMNRINVILQQLNMEPVTIQDLKMIAEYEGNPKNAIEKYGEETVTKLVGKPIDPFKAEQHRIYQDKLAELRTFAHYEYTNAWSKIAKEIPYEERQQIVINHYEEVIATVLKDYELMKM